MTKSLAHTVNLPYEPDSFTIEDLEKAIQELKKTDNLFYYAPYIPLQDESVNNEDLFDLDLNAGVPHG